MKDKNYSPQSDKQYQYIELSNIGGAGEVTGSMSEYGKNLPSRARRLVQKGDVIISSIEGSLQSCALVTKEYNNALCSTGFYVINSKKINAETLLVLFKNTAMQELMKKSCSGTILTAINKDDFLNLPIPLIDKSIQDKIAALITESFALKAESRQLLETAKRAVEIAIEKGEVDALKYIENCQVFIFIRNLS